VSCPDSRATAKTSTIASRAPAMLLTERAQSPRDANTPNSSTAVAPTLAPDDTPSRNGSASALRTRAWTTVPAVVSAAPTIIASSTRGSRICQMISSATTSGLRPPKRCAASTDQTSWGLSATDPTTTPTSAAASNATAPPMSATESRRRAGCSAGRRSVVRMSARVGWGIARATVAQVPFDLRRRRAGRGEGSRPS